VPSNKNYNQLRATSTKRATSFDPAVARAFAEVIRGERVQREIAQDQFALLANVDRSYYGKLERGERQPSLVLLLRIAKALELTGAELVAKVEVAQTAANR
jgi:XRE family transcriptional regulator, regulator of sulfur utilization